MKRLIYACLLLVMTAGLVQAQPTRFAYQAVMHVRESHATNVLDRVDHVVGIGTFRGLAIFENGEVAIHRYEGWFDLINGSGKFHGYALWKFEDDSEIRASYNGVAKTAGSKGFHVEARFRKFSGTGRFAKSKIQGSFSGRRFEAISKGGSTHLKGELMITTDS
jgi:hypothetical protein